MNLLVKVCCFLFFFYVQKLDVCPVLQMSRTDISIDKDISILTCKILVPSYYFSLY